jgi:hypothetical protein
MYLYEINLPSGVCFTLIAGLNVSDLNILKTIKCKYQLIRKRNFNFFLLLTLINDIPYLGLHNGLENLQKKNSSCL